MPALALSSQRRMRRMGAALIAAADTSTQRKVRGGHTSVLGIPGGAVVVPHAEERNRSSQLLH